MNCAPLCTGALYDLNQEAKDDYGFPIPDPKQTKWAGIEGLKIVWLDTQSFLFKAKDPPQRLWIESHVKDDAAAKVAMQNAFVEAFDLVHEHILQLGRALASVAQWTLVSNQAKLQFVLSFLVSTDSGCPDQDAAEHADIVLSVLVDLLESLIGPWSGNNTIPAPNNAAVANLNTEELSLATAHFTVWYTKLHDLCTIFIACIATGNANLPTGRLAERAHNFEAKLRGNLQVQAEQQRRLRRLWHVQRDNSFTRDLPGNPYNITYNNMSSGSCGYNSFTAGVGLNGVNPDPIYGMPAGDANKTQLVVRNKAVAWLKGADLEKDVTDAHWAQVQYRKTLWDIGQTALLSAQLIRRRKTWATECKHRTNINYWATPEDFLAMAMAFKRRIHLYTIHNKPQPDKNKPPIIEYFQYVQSFGNVEYRPVCIAWCNTKGGKFDYMRGNLITDVNRTENHFAVILSVSTPYHAPYMNGAFESALPYEGDEALSPFALPVTKGRIPPFSVLLPPRNTHAPLLSPAQRTDIDSFLAAYDSRKVAEVLLNRVRHAKAVLEDANERLENAMRQNADASELETLQSAITKAEAELEAAELVDTEYCIDEEAACYNYTTDYLTPTQIAFVQRKLKDAHEAFVKHVGNRHNYGQIALMTVPSPHDAPNYPDDDNAPLVLRTLQKQRVTAKRYKQLQDWRGDKYNELVIADWENEKKGSSSYGSRSSNYDDSLVGQAQLVVVQLLLEVFKDWKKFVWWWSNFKGDLVYAQGTDGEKIRNMLMDEVIYKHPDVTYGRGGRLRKATDVFWNFMERARRTLEGERQRLKTGGGLDDSWEFDNYGEGKYIDYNQSKKLLKHLVASGADAGADAGDHAYDGASAERRNLQKVINDAKVLRDTLPGTEERRTLQSAVRQAEKRISGDEDATQDTAAAKKLDEAFFRLLKEYAGQTLAEFVAHRTKKLVHARALLREMLVIGYDDTRTPECGALQGVVDDEERRSVPTLKQDADIRRFWALSCAYDRAFSAVYGEGEDVAKFKGKFEATAVAEDAKRAVSTTPIASPPALDSAAKRVAEKEASNLLQKEQRIIAAVKSKEEMEQDARDLLDKQVQQNRKGQPDEQELEDFLVGARLLSDCDDNVAWRQLVAYLVEEIRVLRRNGKSATSPDVAEKWTDLVEKLDHHASSG